ncbi:MAG: response regulator [Acidiferrobacteraceae bacterium]
MKKKSHAGNRTILLVEDDVDIREGIATVLRLIGFEVLMAKDGQDGLDLLSHATRKPCLILLDLAMPVKDGVQFRKEQEMNSDIASVPVIVMTAHTQAEAMRFRIGAKEVLQKPFTIDRMIEVVHRYCA